MRKLILLLLVALLSLSCKAQLSTVFVNVIKEHPTEVAQGEVFIWKQMPDLTLKVKSKAFTNKTMISLDPGTYIFSFEVNNKVVHNEKLVLTSFESCIVFNLYIKPVRLVDADFNTIAYATPGMLDLISRRMVYMEF